MYIVREDDFGVANVCHLDAHQLAWAHMAGYQESRYAPPIKRIYDSYDDAASAAQGHYFYRLNSRQHFPSQYAGRSETFVSVTWTNDREIARRHKVDIIA